MEGSEVVACQGGDGFRRGLPAIGMIGVERRPEGLAGDAVGAGHCLLEAGDGAGLFPLENGCIEQGGLYHGLQDVERRIALVAG
jgi:hypothetical protein